MPSLPSTHSRPVRADATRLGQCEADRQAALMGKPAGRPVRFPGDGGRRLPPAENRPRQG